MSSAGGQQCSFRPQRDGTHHRHGNRPHDPRVLPGRHGSQFQSGKGTVAVRSGGTDAVDSRPREERESHGEPGGRTVGPQGPRFGMPQEVHGVDEHREEDEAHGEREQPQENHHQHLFGPHPTTLPMARLAGPSSHALYRAHADACCPDAADDAPPGDLSTPGPPGTSAPAAAPRRVQLGGIRPVVPCSVIRDRTDEHPEGDSMAEAVMSLDQGTTSTRAIIFGHDGPPIASDQMEHEQIFPQAGWVEHDPLEIWRNTRP